MPLHSVLRGVEVFHAHAWFMEKKRLTHGRLFYKDNQNIKEQFMHHTFAYLYYYPGTIAIPGFLRCA